MELNIALGERSLEYDGLTRFILNRRVSRCRDKVRKSTAMARAEFVLNNPRLPRQKSAQQRTRALRGLEEGAVDTFDREETGRLLTEFYVNLFRATEKQADLPKWVDLDRQFARQELDGLPRSRRGGR